MGLIYGSLLLEQGLPGDGVLIDAYDDALGQRADVLRSNAFLELGWKIGAHEVTAIDGRPREQQF